MRLALPLALLMSLLATAQDGFDEAIDRLESFVREREVRPLEAAPEWAKRDGKPIFRFAQYADIHHQTGQHQEILRAIEFTNTTLAPDWVILTGDNIADPVTEEHQRELKEILDERLACAYYVVKGDNDERDYEKVFGSSRWSFDCGGVHFVGLGLDYDAEGVGIGYLDRSTYRWLSKDLSANRNEPTVLFMHVNLVPPDFLDAARLGLVLSWRRNLVATITGHLHMDLEARVGQVTHIMAPAIGPHPGHGIKLYEVHEDHITVKTYEVADGTYAFANKWQRIPFPRRLRADRSRGAQVVNYAAADPFPTRWTEGLSNLESTGREWVGRLFRALSPEK